MIKKIIGKIKKNFKTIVITIIIIVIVGSVCFWAGMEVVGGSNSNEENYAKTVVATAKDGSVAKEIETTAQINHESKKVGVNHLDGVVTFVNGKAVQAGGVVYRVGLQSVFAAPGKFPFFRDIVGGESGKDIDQIHLMLVQKSLMSNSWSGKNDANMQNAIKKLQAQNGDDQTGNLPLGSVVAAPNLPTKFTVITETKAIEISDALTAGAGIINANTGKISFLLSLIPEQGNAVPTGTKVVVKYKKHKFYGKMGAGIENQQGGTDFPLFPLNNKSICGKYCTNLKQGDELAAKVILTAPTKGITIPVAAVKTNTDNENFVLLDSGKKIPITIKASADGLAVVTGIEAGQKVLIDNSK